MSASPGTKLQRRLVAVPGNGSGGWETTVKVGSGWNGVTSSLVAPADFSWDGAVDVLARNTREAARPQVDGFELCPSGSTRPQVDDPPR